MAQANAGKPDLLSTFMRGQEMKSQEKHQGAQLEAQKDYWKDMVKQREVANQLNQNQFDLEKLQLNLEQEGLAKFGNVIQGGVDYGAFPAGSEQAKMAGAQATAGPSQGFDPDVILGRAATLFASNPQLAAVIGPKVRPFMSLISGLSDNKHQAIRAQAALDARNLESTMIRTSTEDFGRLNLKQQAEILELNGPGPITNPRAFAKIAEFTDANTVSKTADKAKQDAMADFDAENAVIAELRNQKAKDVTVSYVTGAVKQNNEEEWDKQILEHSLKLRALGARAGVTSPSSVTQPAAQPSSTSPRVHLRRRDNGETMWYRGNAADVPKDQYEIIP